LRVEAHHGVAATDPCDRKTAAAPASFIKFPQGRGTGSTPRRLFRAENLRMEVVMGHLTRDDVARAIGRADDVTIAEIIGSGATTDELAEAQAWIVNDEPLMNAGKPLATGRVRELIDILAALEPDEDDDKEAGVAVG